MKNFSKREPIIPARSIGGVSLGDDARETAKRIEIAGEEVTREAFQSIGGTFALWRVEGWGLEFVEADTRITKVSCTLGYEGSYGEMLYPGIQVAQVRTMASKILFVHGMLVLNGEFGVVLEVPVVYRGQKYDDIDSIDELPLDMRLDWVHVMDREWWR